MYHEMSYCPKAVTYLGKCIITAPKCTKLNINIYWQPTCVKIG